MQQALIHRDKKKHCKPVKRRAEPETRKRVHFAPLPFFQPKVCK
jgi:hypothetical protein